MKTKVCAKLNLTLNVFSKQGQYHPLDSLVLSVDVFDVVQVTKRTDRQVVVDCPNVQLQRNTAFAIATKFVEQFGTTGCNVCIQKGIPFASGMGGSSADASATVFALCKLYNVDANCKEVQDLCASVGSDVNVMLVGGLCRMTGRGEIVEQHVLPQQLHFAVTTFGCNTSTAEIFSEFDSLAQQPAFDNNDKVLEILQSATPWRAFGMFCNSLQPVVERQNPQIANYLQVCQELGLHPTMTGSGSAFFVATTSLAQAKQISARLCQQGFATFPCSSQTQGVQEI